VIKKNEKPYQLDVEKTIFFLKEQMPFLDLHNANVLIFNWDLRHTDTI
jgi:hypothetical protein